MNKKKLGYGIIGLFMLIITAGMALAGLNAGSTKLEDFTLTNPQDNAEFIQLQGYSNADGTYSYVVTMSQDVALDYRDYYLRVKHYPEEIFDEELLEDVPNPESKTRFALEQGVARLVVDSVKAQRIYEHNLNKPHTEFNE